MTKKPQAQVEGTRIVPEAIRRIAARVNANADRINQVAADFVAAFSSIGLGLQVEVVAHELWDEGDLLRQSMLGFTNLSGDPHLYIRTVDPYDPDPEHTSWSDRIPWTNASRTDRFSAVNAFEDLYKAVINAAETQIDAQDRVITEAFGRIAQLLGNTSRAKDGMK